MMTEKFISTIYSNSEFYRQVDVERAAMEKALRKRARNRERQAQRRAMETEEERSLRLEASRKYSAERRANESEEKKAERRLVDRKRAAERRSRETVWEREYRLAMGRKRAVERRAHETDELRKCRLAKNRERLALKRACNAGRAPVNGKIAKTAQTPANGKVAIQDGLGIGQDHHHVSDTIDSDSKAELTYKGAEFVLPSLPVAAAEFDIVSSVEMANVQQQRTVEPAAASSSGGGEEKSSEVKQEVLEIKEFRAVEPNLERHYNDLLKVISEIGRDVKPAYTNNKVSTDRLRKNIMMARGIVRECVQDVDRLSIVAAASTTSGGSL